MAEWSYRPIGGNAGAGPFGGVPCVLSLSLSEGLVRWIQVWNRLNRGISDTRVVPPSHSDGFLRHPPPMPRRIGGNQPEVPSLWCQPFIQQIRKKGRIHCFTKRCLSGFIQFIHIHIHTHPFPCLRLA